MFGVGGVVLESDNLVPGAMVVRADGAVIIAGLRNFATLGYSVGIARWDAEGVVRDANDALLRLAGLGREDVAEGRLRWDALQIAAPRPSTRRSRASTTRMPRSPCRR